LLATLHFLENGGEELRIPLAPASFGIFESKPAVLESPVNYERTVDIEEAAEHELEEHAESEEELDDEDEL